MRHDEAWEWDLNESARKAFLENPVFNGRNDPIRKAAEAAGWRFASNSVLSFIRCPSCKDRPEVIDAEDRRLSMVLLAEIAGDDEDALLSEASSLY
jgi:hypothetical protein